MRRSSRNEDALVAFSTMLALIFLAVTSALACAGLLALYYAKLKEDALIEKSTNFYFPILAATGVTIVIYAGSVAGALLGAAFGYPIRIPPEEYLWRLLLYAALPFWLELVAALYLLHFGVKKSIAKRELVPSLWAKEAKAAYATWMAISFALGGGIAGYLKFGAVGCHRGGPVCRWAGAAGFGEIPALVLTKLATFIDPWLTPTQTLLASIGNQFKLADLCPVIFLVWAAARWVQASRERNDVGVPAELARPQRRPAQSPARLDYASKSHTTAWGVGSLALLGFGMLGASTLSFFIVLRWLD